MAAPKVSVSIITYNQRDFIGQAIESALAQVTTFPVRIHIGDDCSDDGTREILKDWRANHPDRIVLNLQPDRPKGIPGRVNNITNLHSCNGRYVAMLDGDDYWTDPYKLQRQVDFLDENPDYSAAAHDSAILETTTGEMRPLTVAQRSHVDAPTRPADIRQEEALDWRLFQTSSFVFRRDLLSFPDWFHTVHAADYALFLMLSGHGPIRYFPGTWSVYREHAESVMGRISRAERLARFIADRKIFFANLPSAAGPIERNRLLRARRSLAVERNRPAAASWWSARLLLQNPASIGRWLRRRRRDRASF